MQCPHCFPSLVLQGNHGYFDMIIEKEPTKSQLEIPAPKNIVVIFVWLTFVNLALFVIQVRLAHTLIFFQTYAFTMCVCPKRLSVDQTLNAQRTLLTRTCVYVTVATFWIQMGNVHYWVSSYLVILSSDNVSLQEATVTRPSMLHNSIGNTYRSIKWNIPQYKTDACM